MGLLATWAGIAPQYHPESIALAREIAGIMATDKAGYPPMDAFQPHEGRGMALVMLSPEKYIEVAKRGSAYYLYSRFRDSAIHSRLYNYPVWPRAQGSDDLLSCRVSCTTWELREAILSAFEFAAQHPERRPELVCV